MFKKKDSERQPGVYKFGLLAGKRKKDPSQLDAEEYHNSLIKGWYKE